MLIFDLAHEASMKHSSRRLWGPFLSALVAKNIVRATVGAVGLAVVGLPIAYGHRKAMHFLETDEHLFVAAALLGLAGIGARLALPGGQRPWYGNRVQAGGLAVVAGTTALHALAGVADAPRTVLLLLLGLAWPSVAAVAVHSRARPWLAGAVGVAVLAQSGLAGYQFWAAGAHRSLAATGTLFNAGSLGNYLALALPWLVGAARAAVPDPPVKQRVQRLFYAVTAGLAAGALALTGARAAWLGALAGVGLVTGRGWGPPLASHARRWWAAGLGQRVAGLVLLWVVVGVSVWALMHLNAASVYGRWQIYTIGAKLFAQHPVGGVGWGRAASQFNEQQAGYFAAHAVPVARQLLAADTYVLFNSLLQLSIEAGAGGVVAWAGGAWFLWATARRGYREAWAPEAVGAAGALLSVGTSSLFSYPFQVLPVAALTGLMLAWLPTTRPRRSAAGAGPRAVGGALVLAALGLGYREGRRAQALRQWQRAAALAQRGAFRQAGPVYEQARHVLAQDGPFLYNYGVEAGLAGQARRSIDLLEAARPHYTSSALYSYLGQAYEDAGRPQQAGWCYRHASDMVPSRFYPRYQLFELYRTMGRPDQARRVGQELLAYPVKVDTDLTRQIKYRVGRSLRASL